MHFLKLICDLGLGSSPRSVHFKWAVDPALGFQVESREIQSRASCHSPVMVKHNLEPYVPVTAAFSYPKLGCQIKYKHLVTLELQVKHP